ncbi:hypothetical protein [Mycobacteroides abscessus]|uniref:hypothetical protein n=1 Tax=Mycobacteroides abscessus TaxID=36809 RepID=UPI001054CAC0|nr:hypothetical protein [Mycobacteroides abscessus]
MTTPTVMDATAQRPTRKMGAAPSVLVARGIATTNAAIIIATAKAAPIRRIILFLFLIGFLD